MNLTVSQHLNDFSDEMSGDINKCVLKILYNEMCQHLEELHNSANQYFPDDQFMMLRNHA